MLGLGMYLGKLQGPNRPKAPFSATGGQAATSHVRYVSVRWFCDKGSKQKTAARRTVRSQQSRMRQKTTWKLSRTIPMFSSSKDAFSPIRNRNISLDLGNFHRFCEYGSHCVVMPTNAPNEQHLIMTSHRTISL